MEAYVVERAFVRVSGPDAEKYLQGQLSQDVTRPVPGLSFLLEPNGKVVSLLRVVRHGDDSFVLDTDPAAADATEARLKRFLLRTKAEVETIPSAALVRVFGGHPLPQRQVVAAWSDVEPQPQDLLTEDPAGEIDRLGATRLAPEEYERRRILAGVPVSGVDIGADTIPGEVGAWAIEAAASFTKGCYTGQELVARIDSRGNNVPRPLRVLQFDDATVSPAASADVVDADGAVVGHVTSGAAGVALARVGRRVEVGASLSVAGAAATVLR